MSSVTLVKHLARKFRSGHIRLHVHTPLTGTGACCVLFPLCAQQASARHSLFSVTFSYRCQRITCGFCQLSELTWLLVSGMPWKESRSVSLRRLRSGKASDTSVAVGGASSDDKFGVLRDERCVDKRCLPKSLLHELVLACSHILPRSLVSFDIFNSPNRLSSGQLQGAN